VENSTSRRPRDKRDCAGYALLELLISLAVGALLLTILGGMATSTLRMEEKLNADDKTRQNSRRAYTYFQKQILSADKVIVHEGQVYIQDMDSVNLYYNLYTLNAEGVVYRLKYREKSEGLINIGSGQTSHLIDEVENFECQFLPPKSIALRIQFTDGHLLEEVFYIGGEVDER